MGAGLREFGTIEAVEAIRKLTCSVCGANPSTLARGRSWRDGMVRPDRLRKRWVLCETAAGVAVGALPRAFGTIEAHNSHGFNDCHTANG